MTAATWLDDFCAAGVLRVQDLAVARRIAAIGHEPDERVTLALALCLRALQSGSVCVDVASVATTRFAVAEETVDSAALPWPEPSAWLAALRASSLVAVGPEPPALQPARLVDGLLYLERYWGHEDRVRQALDARFAAPLTDVPELERVLDRYFTRAGLSAEEPDRQRAAAAHAARAPLTIVAGGPGTGKTSTVARLLATLVDLADARGDRAPTVALAAPTGKAAVRLTESLRSELALLPERFAPLRALTGTTLHALLGSRGVSAVRFTHGPSNPLPYDLVVVDEASMVSVAMMRRLLDALRPEARLVLVGDPDQLNPVEAGAVLADVVRAPGLPSAAVELTHNWRFGSQIGGLATAIRAGDADATVALLAQAAGSGGAVEFCAVDPASATERDLRGLRARITAAGAAVAAAARDGDVARAVEALDSHRLLCAHRLGAYGVARWSWQAERWLTPQQPGLATDGWSVGLPLLINHNQPAVGLYNGDSGVVVATPDGLRLGLLRGDAPMLLSQAQVSDDSRLFAMTVHKSQGSQFRHVTVVLPPPDSPLLTRELLYTAVTRARDAVTIIGTEASVRAAVERPVVRASGLRNRLGTTPSG